MDVSQQDGVSGRSDDRRLHGGGGLVDGHCGLRVAHVEGDGLRGSQHHYGADCLAGPVDELRGAEHGTDAMQG